MSATVVVDERLMAKAMQLSDGKTQNEVVEDALEELIRSKQRQNIRNLRGKVEWEGDLDEMRQGS